MKKYPFKQEQSVSYQRLKLMRNIWGYPRVVKIAGFDFALDGEWNGRFFASCHGVDADGGWVEDEKGEPVLHDIAPVYSDDQNCDAKIITWELL